VQVEQNQVRLKLAEDRYYAAGVLQAADAAVALEFEYSR
jgi:hypothetical protein